jgi:hypothetical protein
MKTINKFILLILVLSAFSCEDILEKDITDDIVQIIFPIEGSIVTLNTINFQWSSLKGATKYRVQVYNSNQSIALDSLVSKNKLDIQLPTGKYKWKVRGENFGYQSVYSELVGFSTAISDVLTGQKVILTIPEDNLFTKSTTLSLNWQAIPTATSYDVQVVTTAGNTVYSNNNVTTNSIILTTNDISNEAKYQWSVIAKNSGNSTQTDVATRIFSIDRTPPSLPGNLKSGNITPGLKTVDFTWDLTPDNGTIQSLPVNYVFQFATSNTFDAGLFTSTILTGNSYKYTFPASGTYYCRVKALDKAQNESQYSAISQFTLN